MKYWQWALIGLVIVGIIVVLAINLTKQRDRPITHTPWGERFEVYDQRMKDEVAKRDRIIKERDWVIQESEAIRRKNQREIDSLQSANETIQKKYKAIRSDVKRIPRGDELQRELSDAFDRR